MSKEKQKVDIEEVIESVRNLVIWTCDNGLTEKQVKKNKAFKEVVLHLKDKYEYEK